MKWNSEDIKILCDLYPNTESSLIAKKLNRTVGAVASKANNLNLKRNDDFAFFLREKTIRNLEKGIPNRFKKGNISPLKGKKLTKEQLDKIKPYQFKKGNIPHNLQPIGTEFLTNDGYVLIKVFSDKGRGNYVFKHRFIWEQNFGEIPNNSVVVFKDGNKLNFSIDNLELLSKKDHCERNNNSDKVLLKKMGIEENEVDFYLKNGQSLLQLKRSQLILNKSIKKWKKK